MIAGGIAAQQSQAIAFYPEISCPTGSYDHAAHPAKMT
jgi:hypothetical protein